MTAVRLAIAPAAYGSYQVWIVGENGTPIDGYDLAADTALARLQAQGQLNGLGEAVVNLLPTAAITPAGTRYRADLRATGSSVAVQVIFSVPDSPTQVDALDHLSEVPGALNTAALDAHLAAIPGHAASQVSFTPTGTVAATNVQAAIAEVAAESAGGSYTHTQATPAASWTVTHNLGYRPAVTVFDASGVLVITDFTHASINALTITFAAPIAGVAHLS